MFWILHLIAIAAFPVALFVTIPLHIISGAVRKPEDPDKPSPDTHVICPDCREYVRKDARICKHCRCSLTPQP